MGALPTLLGGWSIPLPEVLACPPLPCSAPPSPKLHTLTVTNRGASALHVTGAHADNSQFSTVGFQNVEVPVGGSQELTVEYLPHLLGGVEAKLVVYTSRGSFSVKMRATGVESPYVAFPLYGAKVQPDPGPSTRHTTGPVPVLAPSSFPNRLSPYLGFPANPESSYSPSLPNATYARVAVNPRLLRSWPHPGDLSRLTPPPLLLPSSR